MCLMKRWETILNHGCVFPCVTILIGDVIKHSHCLLLMQCHALRHSAFSGNGFEQWLPTIRSSVFLLLRTVTESTMSEVDENFVVKSTLCPEKKRPKLFFYYLLKLRQL